MINSELLDALESNLTAIRVKANRLYRQKDHLACVHGLEDAFSLIAERMASKVEAVDGELADSVFELDIPELVFALAVRWRWVTPTTEQPRPYRTIRFRFLDPGGARAHLNGESIGYEKPAPVPLVEFGGDRVLLTQKEAFLRQPWLKDCIELAKVQEKVRQAARISSSSASPADQRQVGPDDTSIGQAPEGESKARARARLLVVDPILETKGWSLLDWSKKAGVDYHTVQDYLNGKTKALRAENRRAMAEALGIPLGQLPK
jgi:lambda repressor-like predicted transcriptional regulator